VGRRVYPDYNLAENSLNLLAARLLWPFDVHGATDPATGREVKYDTWNYDAESLFGPRPFSIEFKVRNGKKEAEIRKTA
jgi:hypothetical protein